MCVILNVYFGWCSVALKVFASQTVVSDTVRRDIMPHFRIYCLRICTNAARIMDCFLALCKLTCFLGTQILIFQR
uniref:Uncharacterized protein n=1 Tax=Human betaherpesvirus 6 TaxID=10368 RepID=A0A5P9U8K8_9BETA|nr:hypothetical protein [Human betaherpesvirus 6]